MFLRKGLITKLLLIGLSMFAIAADSALPPVDTAAPDFALKDASGVNVRLSELRTEVVLINFWSSWCRSCRSEMPKLNELHAEFADTDLQMIGVNVDDDYLYIANGAGGQRNLPALSSLVVTILFVTTWVEVVFNGLFLH